MVALKLSNVYDGVFRGELALESHARNHAARERLAVVMDELRRNQGWSVVMRGHDLRLREPPADFVNERAKPPLKIQRRRRSAPAGLTTYVPLRVRSYYTFLDSTLSPGAIVHLAKQHGLSAIALTDLGNLHGAVEFAQAAQRAGIQPIFGTELRVGSQPLLLYVESADGYRQLNGLLSQPAEGGRQDDETAVAARQRAPVTFEFLAHHAAGLEGLIAVSPDLRLAELFPAAAFLLSPVPPSTTRCRRTG
jgi:hypothetical protein